MESLFIIVKKHWKEILIYSILTLLWATALRHGYYDGVHEVYAEGIKNFDAEAFNLPLFYFVGIFFYLILGEFAFVLLPLALFFGATAFQIKLHKEFKLPILFIPLNYFIAFKVVGFLAFFSRDSLLFFLASAFTYYWAKSIYRKKKCWKRNLILCCAMALTKSFGAIFFLLYALTLVKNYKFNSAMAFFNPEWIQNMFVDVYGGLKHIFVPRIHGIAALLPNPIYFISAIALTKTFDKNHLFLLFLTAIISVSVYNMGYLTGELLRYTFALAPLHFFYIGAVLKEPNNFYYYLFYFIYVNATFPVIALMLV